MRRTAGYCCPQVIQSSSALRTSPTPAPTTLMLVRSRSAIRPMVRGSQKRSCAAWFTNSLTHSPASRGGTADRFCTSSGSPGARAPSGTRLDTRYGLRFAFLDEHLACGLPRPPDVVAMVREAEPDARVRVLFQDGVRESERLLMDAAAAVKGHQAPAFLRLVRAWFWRRSPQLTERASADNNRAYLVIDQPAR